MSHFISTVQVFLDTQTLKLALEDLSTSSGFFEGRIIAIDSFSRELAEEPNHNFRVSGLNIRISDEDGEMAKLRGQTAWRNRKVEISVGELEDDISSHIKVYTGKIVTWNKSSTRSEYIIRISDATFNDIVDRNLGGFINASETGFQNRPGGQPTQLKTIIYGKVSNVIYGGEGAIPCYPVDLGVADPTKFRYFVARHICKSVDRIYQYGVEVDAANWTVFNDGTNQFVDLNFNPEDVNRAGELAISADAQGITDTGLASGTLITNPATQMKHYLENYVGIAPADISSASFTKAETNALNLGYVGGFAIVDPNITHETVLNRFGESYSLNMFIDRTGLYSVSLPAIEDIIDLTVIPHLTDELDIIRDSFNVDPADSMASRLQYNFAYNWKGGFFEQQPDLISTDEQTAQAGDFRENSNLWYVRDQGVAINVATERLFALRENSQVMTVDLPFKEFGIDLGDYVEITHSDGIASDGLGYRRIIFIVTAVRLFFSGRRTRIKIKGVRVTDIDTSGGFWSRYIRFGDGTEIASTWLTATSEDKEFWYLADETDVTGSPEGTLGTEDPAKLMF